MNIILVIALGALLLYALYLRVQLYISQRIITALQETTVTAPAERGFDARPALAALGGLILLAGVVTAWMR